MHQFLNVVNKDPCYVSSVTFGSSPVTETMNELGAGASHVVYVAIVVTSSYRRAQLTAHAERSPRRITKYILYLGPLLKE